MASEDESLVPDASLKDARAATSHHRRNSGKVNSSARTGDRRAPETWRRDIVALSAAASLLIAVIVIDAPLRAELVLIGVSLEWTAIDASSYDLFLATLGTVMSALIALYFTVAATVLAFLKEDHPRKRAFDAYFQTWWVVPPVILVELIFVLLALSPYRIRPFTATFPIIFVLVIASLYAFGALAHVLRSAFPIKPND